MKAKETLETALELVTGDRAEQHGDMHATHQMAADLWNAYIGDGMLTAEDVALMLALLKIARMQNGSKNEDNYVDLAGYAGVAAQLAEGPEPQYIIKNASAADWEIGNGVNGHGK